ncbi:DNA-damage-repair/toleration protein DRT111, chloroplastic [Linum grandiflorum]
MFPPINSFPDFLQSFLPCVLPQNLVPDYENFWSECPWDEDLKYATAVCNQVFRCFPGCCKWDGIRFDYIASGHYASVVHPFSGHVDQPSVLELVGVQSLVIEEYDPARPNDYEDYMREKKRKALEAERLRELERRRQEDEEREKVEKEQRERDRERDKNISGEEAWRRRAAMS